MACGCKRTSMRTLNIPRTRVIQNSASIAQVQRILRNKRSNLTDDDGGIQSTTLPGSSNRVGGNIT